jgi:branched-subunit amino acid transport protein
MSWATIITIGAGAYLFKVLGLIVLGGRRLPTFLHRCLDLLPAALLPALIAINTVTSGRHLVIDARLPGVAVAAFATQRRWPFPVVLVLAASVTALVRHLAR